MSDRSYSKQDDLEARMMIIEQHLSKKPNGIDRIRLEREAKQIQTEALLSGITLWDWIPS